MGTKDNSGFLELCLTEGNRLINVSLESDVFNNPNIISDFSSLTWRRLLDIQHCISVRQLFKEGILVIQTDKGLSINLPSGSM